MSQHLNCCCDMHREAVEKGILLMPQANEIAGLSGFFKVLGDPTRIKMMCVMEQGELCLKY